MAKARTTTATAVEEPIVEQNIETTSVVEEPQTVSEEPTVVEEDGNNETTTEGTAENITEEDTNNEGTTQTPVEGDNNGANTDAPVEKSLEEEFIEMTGINKPYAEGIMDLPNADYYIPVGSGVDLEKRNTLIEKLKADKNETTEAE